MNKFFMKKKNTCISNTKQQNQRRFGNRRSKKFFGIGHKCIVLGTQIINCHIKDAAGNHVNSENAKLAENKPKGKKNAELLFYKLYFCSRANCIKDSIMISNTTYVCLRFCVYLSFGFRNCLKFDDQLVGALLNHQRHLLQ